MAVFDGDAAEVEVELDGVGDQFGKFGRRYLIDRINLAKYFPTNQNYKRFI